MLIAPCTINEEERIRTLDEYGILDSEQEAVFDNITRIAMKICDVPIALISLVDHERQWFKSKVGLEVAQTHRDIAFCTHAILQDDIFEVEDATLDKRFHDNPLVTDSPHIRFYAGVPLSAHNGAKLGTLCVISDKANKLNEEQRELLKVLAKDVVSKLELRRQAKSLKNASRVQTRLIQSLEQSNQELEAISYKLANELSAPLDGVQKAISSITEFENLNPESVNKLASSTRTLENVQSLIMLMLDDARIRTSYEHPEPINLKTLVKGLSVQLKWPDSFVLDIQDIEVSLPRIPLSTVLANLITNSIQHHHKSAGKISIVATDNDDHYLFTITDDGPGVSDKIERGALSFASSFNMMANKGIGLATVKRIVEHHDGNLRLSNLEKGGTEATVYWLK